MDLIQALILSVVEGLTEFLPISSTGHLILTSDILNIEQTNFIKSFEIYIQLGAILAVVFLYFKKLKKKEVILPTLAAFIPTAIVGLLFYPLIKNVLIGNSLITVAALFWGGILIILVELFYKEKDHHLDDIENIPLKKAILIGIFQSVSVIPGVSRAAATIIGARLTGMKRVSSAEFSFILALPTMLAATGLDLVKSDFSFSSNELFLLATGFLGSFVVALLAMKFLIDYIQKHSFILFGVYRIILAILFWIFILR
ncbi:MAG: undecaprenyl-diphosphatase UppP [Candidatus Levybacteria bacterium]|nr:undecaprenyl-diphosphatase UppP [Candidatus Levybacteria bacterium]